MGKASVTTLMQAYDHYTVPFSQGQQQDMLYISTFAVVVDTLAVVVDTLTVQGIAYTKIFKSSRFIIIRHTHTPWEKLLCGDYLDDIFVVYDYLPIDILYMIQRSPHLYDWTLYQFKNTLCLKRANALVFIEPSCKMFSVHQSFIQKESLIESKFTNIQVAIRN